METSKPLTVEYKIRFDFRESGSDATVNIFLDPPSEEDWWNDPIGVGHSGEINGDVLNFLHSFGPNSGWGGKVGVCDDIEGGDLPARSAPYPKDGEWVTVRVMMSETGFEVLSVGEKGYHREESCAYDLSGVKYIGVGFGDQYRTKVEVDYIKVYYGPVSVSTDKERYKLGETIKLLLYINRSADMPVVAQFTLELEEPGGTTDMIYQSGAFTMPAEFQFTTTVPFYIPVSYFVVDGEYSFVATLIEPTTGTILGKDTATFYVEDKVQGKKLSELEKLG